MLYIEQYPEIVPPIIIFLLAFFLGLHGTLVTRILSLRFNVLDHPGGRKAHDAPVPCLGGLAIVFAVTVSLLLSYGRSPEIIIILAVGLGIALAGLLDDISGVPAWVKLVVLAVGCGILMMNGIGLNRTPFPVVNALLTLLWIAGVSSAFNAIDNTDGLAGSICAISAAGLFLMGWSTWQLSFSFLAMALAGGVLGFLHFNVKPARIYMGDTGSFYLGYILSVLVIFGEWSESGVRSFLAGCFVLAFPIYDLGLTTLLRARHGVISGLLSAIAYSDRDHLSHRLLKMGLSHGQMLRTLCLLSCGCGCVALVVANAPVPVAVGVVAIAVAGLAWLGLYLDRQTSVPDLWLHPPAKMLKKER